MKEKLSLLKSQAKEEILKLVTLQEVEDFRVKYLGKKGLETEITKGMKNLTAEDRHVIGKLINKIRK